MPISRLVDPEKVTLTLFQKGVSKNTIATVRSCRFFDTYFGLTTKVGTPPCTARRTWV